ncbi:hypothetical protein K435DRAFT_970657, partial [Dendrothele bispora CBS 962.96]
MDSENTIPILVRALEDSQLRVKELEASQSNEINSLKKKTQELEEENETLKKKLKVLYATHGVKKEEQKDPLEISELDKLLANTTTLENQKKELMEKVTNLESLMEKVETRNQKLEVKRKKYKEIIEGLEQKLELFSNVEPDEPTNSTTA